MYDLNPKSIFIPENFDKSNLNKVYVVLKEQNLLVDDRSQNLAVLDEEEMNWSGMEVAEKFFLGYLDKKSCYAVELSSKSQSLEGSSFKPFRALLGLIPDTFFKICSRSVQLIDWHNLNKFCGSCGSQTSLHSLERAMHCLKCNKLYYPRISPCIIVLISKDEDILLARNKNFPSKFYSTLAGFVEPGENVEEAIHREIYEEVSIKVKNISYYGSQSWPFPSQLMLGFNAEYESGTVEPDGVEIDSAEWFSIYSLPQVPPANISISGKLIENYVTEKAKRNLPGFS